MHKRTARVSALVAAAAALTFAVAGCGSDSEPDEAACKEAISKGFKDAAAGKEGALEDKPEACEGISDKTGQRLVQEVQDEEMKGIEESLDAP
ncbi:hypothetical protein OG946_01315 [Streptomyces sp. NBC_01808]|uniref:hypothetical protein n=1 Tax=Streptomyces sp. NBC_01808 TaxID=2975947 RepID=UPI002DDA790F|nr:hypothetical protein [Streptomyces sp. NBC_01808]WSA36126.1 hypothetical protein OG946_01315 [Streptomyces sp. NBC_01808]